MGVILEDLGGRLESLSCNWWNWRPTLEIVREAEIVTDPQRLELLGANAGQEVYEEEAREIARHLVGVVLPALCPGERVRLDLSSTSEPDDGTFYREPEEQHLNYSATYGWLSKLQVFCSQCEGFAVY